MTIAIIILAVAALLIRQFRAREIRTGLFIAVPAVLLGLAARALDHTPPATAASVALLAVGATTAIALGILRGVSERVWHAPDGSALHQSTIVTLLLWVATVAVRGIVIVAERTLGVHVDVAAEIELVCGASLAAQFAVVSWRAGLLGGVRAAVAG
jgi:hypothetical protein